MAAIYEPSLSASLSRISLAPAPSSMGNSLPSLNFGFDELRDRMARFTAKFDTYIEQGRKRVLEERNQFRMNIAEIQEDERMKRRDMEILQLKTAAQRQTAQKEVAEVREMQAAIAALTAQRDQHAAARDSLLAVAATTQAEVQTRLAAQAAHERQQATLARYNAPELDFWTATLGLAIEGVGRPDCLRFVFTCIDERDWDRDAWFVLSTAARDYDVVECRPRLDRNRIDRALERVNESREFAVLLRAMRDLFVDAIKAA